MCRCQRHFFRESKRIVIQVAVEDLDAWTNFGIESWWQLLILVVLKFHCWSSMSQFWAFALVVLRPFGAAMKRVFLERLLLSRVQLGFSRGKVCVFQSF